MAPKRGGGGSSSSGSSGSGSSGCEHCNDVFILRGADWRSTKNNAYFAIEIIVLIVLIVCLVLATRFKWTRQHGTDKLRKAGYIFATICAIINHIIFVVDAGLREARTEVTYLYYLVYIFAGLFWRLSELIVLAVILRTIAESCKMRALNTVNIVVVSLLALVSTATYGLYVAWNAITISQGNDFLFYDDESNYERVYKAYWHAGVAYEALYLLISIVALIFGFLAVIKERSKQALIMIALVLPAMFLRSLMAVLYQASFDSGRFGDSSLSYESQFNISWAATFIDPITTAAILLGVAIIGILRPANGVLPHKSYGTVPQNQMAYNNQPGGYVPTGYGHAEMESANQPHVVR